LRSNDGNPNSELLPNVAPNPGQAVYLDGWETTLTAEWVGTGTPQLANWINLDTILLQFPNSYANLVFEWAVDGVTYRQAGVAYAMDGHVYAEKVQRDATNAVSFDDTGKPIPNGARVYIPLMAGDIQFLVKRTTALSYSPRWAWQPFLNQPLGNPMGQDTFSILWKGIRA
jgi:hypothetical protein